MFDFDDQSSRILIEDAELNIDVASQTIDGSIETRGTGTTSGLPLILSKAVLIKDGSRAVITGEYDGSAGPDITLSGDDTLEGRDGFVLDTVAVSGTNNTIAGDLVFSEDLTLLSGVGVNLKLNQRMNKSVVLDSGTLTLKKDLRFDADTYIKGSGTVAAGAYSVFLANSYASALTSTLTWQSARGIVLGGSTTLNSTWTFSGTNIIDGRGQTLELGSSGVLSIAADSTLELRNVTLRGLTNTKIIFGNANATLKIDGCTFYLGGALTTTSGKVTVVNDTTFVHRSYDWTFSSSGVLTVDGATLFLNNLTNDTEATLGTIKAPNAIFINHEKQPDNITANLTAGNLITPNLGIVTEVSERVVDGVTVVEVETAPTLTKSSLMGPGDKIEVTATETIDGKGSRIFFGRTATPQLTVAAGKTLTLKNIELHGLTDTSIDLGAAAKIRVEENVIFTLNDDMTWDVEQLEVADDVVFQIRGSGKRRRFRLSSPAIGERPHEIEYEKHLNIGTGSVQLQNAILSGTQHVLYGSKIVDGKKVVGALVLAGNATLEIERSITDLHTVVAGQGNQLQVMRSDVTQIGSLSFDDYSVNDISLRFALPSTYNGTPRIHFDDEYLSVSSKYGQAKLVFEDSIVRVRNKGANSVIFGENSMLRGHMLEVEEYPFKQKDKRFSIYTGTRVNSNLAEGAIAFDETLQEIMRGGMHGTMPLTTTYTLAREAVFEGLYGDLAYDENELRGLLLPDETFKTVLKYVSAFALPPLRGNIMLQSSEGDIYRNMRISPDAPLNLTLENAVSVQQAEAPMTVKNTDIINVRGGSLFAPNRISLRDETTINGKLLLDDYAVLVFDFSTAATPPTVTIGADALIECGKGSILAFSGKGVVTFADGVTLNLGTSDATILYTNGAECVLSGGQQVTTRGEGTIEFADGARLIVENGSSFICGTKITDTLGMRVMTSASVRVGQDLGNTTVTDRSYISFAGSRGTLDCSRFGSFVISTNGALECNVLRGAARPGKMNNIDLSMGGSLFIGDGGQLTLGENAGGMGGTSWNMLGGTIGGAGTVALHDSLLSGKVQPALFSASLVTSESL
ncbi:MAG: hypothetical protein PVJ92_01955, partial [Candidatus Dependentiae bacterium]